MSKCEFNKLHFGRGVLLYIKFAACIFSEHIFLRTPLDGCFWYRLFSTLPSCIWKGVYLHVMETKWEAKIFIKIFMRFFKGGGGRGSVEIKPCYILPWTNWVTIFPLKRSGISRGVHKKPQIFLCDLGIPTNQQGQDFHSIRKVREFVKGSWKSQGRKFLSMQIFNFNKKIICTQKFVQLNCIWQSVVYMMLLFASNTKMIIVQPHPHPFFFLKGREVNFDYLPRRGESEKF